MKLKIISTKYFYKPFVDNVVLFCFIEPNIKVRIAEVVSDSDYGAKRQWVVRLLLAAGANSPFKNPNGAAGSPVLISPCRSLAKIFDCKASGKSLT